MAPSRAFVIFRKRFALQGKLHHKRTLYGSSCLNPLVVTQPASYSGISSRVIPSGNASQSSRQYPLRCRQNWLESTSSGRFQSRQSSSAAAKQSIDSVEAPDYLNEKERELFELLKAELSPTSLEVADVSGGCGSMYAVNVTSERFRGLPMVKQHRLVNEILGEEIKNWHGLQLRTKVPS